MPISLGVQLFLIFTVALIAAAIISFHLDQLRRGSRTGASAMLEDGGGRTVFLFDDGTLVDASSSAQDLLTGRQGETSDWDHLMSVLSSHFPDIKSEMAAIGGSGRKRLAAPNSAGLELKVDAWDGMMRLALVSKEDVDSETWVEQLRLSALAAEAQTLRGIAESSPNLIWIEGPDHQILWANRSYLALADNVSGHDADQPRPWPPRQLFEGQTVNREDAQPAKARLPLQTDTNGAAQWFDVTSAWRDGKMIHFASDCTSIVQAESAQRSFVETMGKTFAQLSIGLMIFDKQRRLMTFNPAATDLTGLPFDFLSARPVLTTVLDRLREAQMLPEPKDYSSWREEIAALESAAKNGTYCETWNLPNGSTYRVTGRPNPNGAIAFLFEDISAEISLNRHFRAELELSAGVFDAVDEAIAVFSASGSMAMSNKSYARLWQRSGNTSLAESGVIEESQLWQECCAPTPIWRDIRDFVSGFGDRSAWEEVVVLRDGRQYLCKVGPIAGNATLVGFRRVHDMMASIPPSATPLRPRTAKTG